MPLKGHTGGRRIGTGATLASVVHGPVRPGPRSPHSEHHGHADGTDRDPAHGYLDELELPRPKPGI